MPILSVSSPPIVAEEEEEIRLLLLFVVIKVGGKVDVELIVDAVENDEGCVGGGEGDERAAAPIVPVGLK